MWVMKFQVQEVFRWPFLYFFEIEFKKKKKSVNKKPTKQHKEKQSSILIANIY